MFTTPSELRVWIYSRAAFAVEARAKALVEYLISHTEFAPNRFGPYELFQPPRRVPEFPFRVVPPTPKPVDREIAEAKQAFENMEPTLVRAEELTLVFRGEGGITKVTVGPHGHVAYWPGVNL